MKTVTTTRFGVLSVNDEDVLHFPKGIPGFYDHYEWILAGEDENPIKWLQSLSDEAIALPVMPPQVVLPEYNAKIVAGDLEDLSVDDDGDLSTMAVVSIPPDAPWNMTANLRAPIVVNVKKRLAKQVICANDEYSMRAFVLSDAVRASCEAQASRGSAEEAGATSSETVPPTGGGRKDSCTTPAGEEEA
ncbi:flagellar assembly protein FliW [Aminiphilus sp.]|uniref:flagellar assembly protein FliW n=1 Tax=Aminiphilus sp. TaxID=1872488 RepID=UPI002605838B|nr:flagellar assembly protein FliW [Aminiphilus sp.]